MKTGIMLIGSLVLVYLIPFAGYADNKYVPTTDEVYYATWINKETYPQKMVKYSDGTFEDYELDETTPFRGGTSEIIKKWTDTEGNVFYDTYDAFTKGSMTGYKVQSLWKISKSGTVCEMVWTPVGIFDSSGFPAAIDPKSDRYFIFYRAEK
jgi:hypothetical protein